MRHCDLKNPYVKTQVLTFALIPILACTLSFASPATAESDEQPDFEVLVGEWVRPDGGYIVRVRGVNPDGSVDVGYFNPGEINVAEARVSLWKGLVKLFIKLQDKGYPGSTYTLYYFAEKDALVGFYDQVAMGKTFEVFFLRSTGQ
jgi:hypothetical protein